MIIHYKLINFYFFLPCHSNVFYQKENIESETALGSIFYSSQPIKLQIFFTLAKTRIFELVSFCFTGKTHKNISQRDSQKRAQVPAIPHIQNLDPFSQSSEVR